MQEAACQLMFHMDFTMHRNSSFRHLYDLYQIQFTASVFTNTCSRKLSGVEKKICSAKEKNFNPIKPPSTYSKIKWKYRAPKSTFNHYSKFLRSPASRPTAIKSNRLRNISDILLVYT